MCVCYLWKQSNKIHVSLVIAAKYAKMYSESMDTLPWQLIFVYRRLSVTYVLTIGKAGKRLKMQATSHVWAAHVICYMYIHAC